MALIEATHAHIYYERYGDGPPVIFAHGAGGNAASWWQQLPYFVERYTVIAFDHRMFGRSECAPSDFHGKYFADDLRRILDAEGIDRAALVCQSMGGWTGSRFALEAPDRVGALVMSHTPGCFTNEEVRARREEAFRQVDRNTMPPGRFAHWAVGERFHETDPRAAFLYTQISSLNYRVDRARLSTLMSDEVLVELETISDYRTPTLFVTANGDRIFPPELIRAVATLVSGAEFDVLGDVGHSSYFESPERFNARVDQFFAKHWPATH